MQGVGWRMRGMNGGVESGGGDGSQTGSVTEEEEGKINDRYRCQPHTGLQG